MNIGYLVKLFKLHSNIVFVYGSSFYVLGTSITNGWTLCSMPSNYELRLPGWWVPNNGDRRDRLFPDRAGGHSHWNFRCLLCTEAADHCLMLEMGIVYEILKFYQCSSSWPFPEDGARDVLSVFHVGLWLVDQSMVLGIYSFLKLRFFPPSTQNMYSKYIFYRIINERIFLFWTFLLSYISLSVFSLILFRSPVCVDTNWPICIKLNIKMMFLDVISFYLLFFRPIHTKWWTCLLIG
jgi:hypothetical protein